MNFKKINYFFQPHSHKQEQALFIILFITLIISALYLYISLQRGYTELIYLKGSYLCLDLIFLALLYRKKLNIRKTSKIFMILLFFYITLDIFYTTSKIELLLLLIFFPISSLMICTKKLSAYIITLFIVMNTLLYTAGLTHIHLDYYDSLSIFLGIILFVSLIGFYINALDKHREILQNKNLQIKQQHTLLSNIFNKAPIIFSSFDKNGYVTFISDYESKLIGQTIKELQGKHYTYLYKDHPDIIQRFDAFYEHHDQEFIYQIYEQHFDFRLNHQKDGSGCSMIAMDVSEQIRFKDALQKSEDRLEIVTNTAFEAIIISQGDKIVKANQKAVEMFGYKSIKDIINQNIRQFVTVDSIYSIYKQSLKNDENPQFIRGIREDGTSFPMELKGKNIDAFDKMYRVSAIQSLDKLSKAKDEIAKLAQVVEQNSSIIMIADAQGFIQYVNQAFVNKMGYSKDEVINRKPHMLSSGHHKASFYEDLWPTLAKGEVWSKEMNNRTKAGEIITVKNNISFIKNDLGEVTHYIAMQEDITYIKEQERMIFAQTKQAQMGEMLSMIAHQWRQPLSAISVIGAKMRFAIELDALSHEMIKENLAMVDHQVQFLSDTIDDFRSFFKPNKERVTITAQALIKKAISIISEKIKLHNVTLNVDTTVDVKITTYTHEVVQVLLSLIQNSLDQLISKLLVSKEISLEVLQEKAYCLITVKDTGGGIPHTIIDDIFLPYFSTKNEKQGTGLGLHMCKTIVEDHCHGSISVENWEDGVCFYVRLPL